MEFFIINLVLLLFTYQLHDVSAKRHGPGHHDDSYEDNKDDSNDLSDHCIHIRIDHDTRFTDYLICPFGCCGTLDDQKCCEDPVNAKQEGHGNVYLVRGLLIFAGVMLIIAVTSCVFGIYKHKKAKLRKTTPGRNAETRTPSGRAAPYTIFYTPNSGMRPGDDSNSRQSPRKHSEQITPIHVRTAPPRYTEKPEVNPDVQPYPVQSPPPPYTFSALATAPGSTEIHISN